MDGASEESTVVAAAARSANRAAARASVSGGDADADVEDVDVEDVTPFIPPAEVNSESSASKGGESLASTSVAPGRQLSAGNP